MGMRDIALRYGETILDEDDDKQRIDNVSAVTFGDGHLWTVADEKATFERLTPAKGGLVYENARSFQIDDYFAGLPPAPDEKSVEVDFEGLCFDSGRLWLAGSHALIRKSYKKGATPLLLSEDSLERQDMRTLRGFVEVVNGEPVEGSGRALPFGEAKGGLIDALRSSEFPLLAEATHRPAKENGLDIEGLAVEGMRVFLGLRGPVVGPYAILVELDVEPAEAGLRIVRPDGKPACRPHLLDTEGLGIRDLAVHTDGLAILAGPTMDADGPFDIRLWPSLRSGWQPDKPTSRKSMLLKKLGSQDGTRRAEGIALVDGRVLVVAERKDRPNDLHVLMAQEHVIPALA